MNVTVLYAFLHMLVDGVCALAMFGKFLSAENAYENILLYNFCAFALQMPFGAILDILHIKAPGIWHNLPFFTAAAGVFGTVFGALTHPAVLGIGNALFHIGGGIGTIYEDRNKSRGGLGLGIFVAPGALGLYIGMLAAKSTLWKEIFFAVSIIMLFVCIAAAYGQKHGKEGKAESCTKNRYAERIDKRAVWLSVCCFFVVILRSYIGMNVAFPWKTGVLSGIAATAAIVCGKIAGGFFSAWYGSLKTICISLFLAAFCYFFSSFMPIGVCALFLFNMTMPVTLCLLAGRLPRLPGFSFGLLTFALFLGFLPGYFGGGPFAGGNLLGCFGSIISLLVLAAGIFGGGVHGQLSD